MSNKLKTFLAVHTESSGCFNEPDKFSFYVVTANTKGEALGLLLEYERTSEACDWQINEIDTQSDSVGVKMDSYDFGV